MNKVWLYIGGILVGLLVALSVILPMVRSSVPAAG